MGVDRTPAAALTARARELWECLAEAAAGFTPAVSVAVSPRSYLCPPGWVGIVVLGDAALAIAPDHQTAHLIEQALSGLPAASLTRTDVLSRRLAVAEVLGPVALAYLDPAEFRPRPGDAVTRPVGLAVAQAIEEGGCRNGGHDPRPPGVLPRHWDSANLASR